MTSGGRAHRSGKSRPPRATGNSRSLHIGCMTRGRQLRRCEKGGGGDLRGYVSLSMMTRLTLATQPWSQVAMMDDVICAMPIATASPFVVMTTTSSSTSMPSSYLNNPTPEHDGETSVRLAAWDVGQALSSGGVIGGARMAAVRPHTCAPDTSRVCEDDLSLDMRGWLFGPQTQCQGHGHEHRTARHSAHACSL